MSNVNKPTKRDMFAALKAVVENANPANRAALCDFIDHEIDLLARKKASNKPTPAQAFTEKVKQAVYEELVALPADNIGVRASDLLTNPHIVAVAEESGEPLRIQRITSALTALRTEGKVKRTTVKKVSFFSVGKDTEGDEDAE